jgi:hypothetical protein
MLGAWPRSRIVAEGQLFAKYPHIPHDAADQRRKMKTGEMSRWQSARCPLAHLRPSRRAPQARLCGASRLDVAPEAGNGDMVPTLKRMKADFAYCRCNNSAAVP